MAPSALAHIFLACKPAPQTRQILAETLKLPARLALRVLVATLPLRSAHLAPPVILPPDLRR